MNSPIQYFPGLPALRFIAAFLVVMHHAEQIRMKYGLFHLKTFSLFQNGSLAVRFFFVLSGFLITYLLIREKNQTQNISIAQFYLRRVYRIWPLYYLLVIIGLFVLPIAFQLIHYNYQFPYQPLEVLPYFIFFLPFLVNILFGHHILEPLWSIGVEEIFYLFAAPLLKWGFKNIIYIIAALLLLKYSINIIVDGNSLIGQVNALLQFESMLLGGMGAWVVYYNPYFVQRTPLLFSKTAQFIFTGLILMRLICHDYLLGNWSMYESFYATPVAGALFNDLLFLWLMINISVNPNRIYHLENKITRYLGDISYGIYMYQMLVIFGVILLTKPLLQILSPLSGTLVFYLLLSAGIIITAGISKRYLEDYFLQLKNKLHPLVKK